jgi:hypothetical protein
MRHYTDVEMIAPHDEMKARRNTDENATMDLRFHMERPCSYQVMAGVSLVSSVECKRSFESQPEQVTVGV